MSVKKFTKAVHTIAKQLMTGPDGKTTEIARLAGMSGWIMILVFQSFMTFVKGVWSPVEFCAGAGGYLTAWAGAIWIKRAVEPKPDFPTFETPEPTEATVSINYTDETIK